MVESKIMTPMGKPIKSDQVPGRNPNFYEVAKIKAVINVPEAFEDHLFSMSKEQIRGQFPSICLIGATGSGKSSTCNTLCG